MIVIIVILLIIGIIYRAMITRVYDGYKDRTQSIERAKYYELANGSDFQDITQKLITDHSISEELKQPLITGQRRIAVFKYQSDTQTIAGYISYLTQGKHPAMIFLRGGNGYYGIMRPNNKYSFWENYHVVGTLYRGNIYGGKDNYGGDDVNDVEDLIRYFPQLEKKSDIVLRAPYTMMGVSRGSMQMFATLSRSDYVKDRVDHAISISGNLSLFTSAKNRLDMKFMFYSQFIASNNRSLDEWIRYRNPADNVTQLSKSIKVLLFYGMADDRVSLAEQNEMKKALDENGIVNQLVVFDDGDHGLSNHQREMMNIGGTFMK